MLLTVMARLQLRHPADQLSCQTFGSPPVLAHRGGGGSADVLQVMCRQLEPHGSCWRQPCEKAELMLMLHGFSLAIL